MKKIKHSSDCAIHNKPALPKGECNCYVSVIRKDEREKTICKLDSDINNLYKYRTDERIHYFTILEVLEVLKKL